MGSCAAGFHCDCNANTICELVSTVYYNATENTDEEEFECSQSVAKTPRLIVGMTTDFHIVAYQEFQLFVNNEQIGFGEANQLKVFTAEIRADDVVAVAARRQSQDKFGVKLRFKDLQGETRFIDENWQSSDTFSSSWLSKTFSTATHNWTSPSITSTVTDVSFDSNVPWVWLNDADTVYFRYVIPQAAEPTR